MPTSTVTLSGPEGLSLQLPDDFQPLSDAESAAPARPEGAAPALSAAVTPWRQPGTFRPRVTVWVDSPSPDRATLTQLSAATIAGELAAGRHVAAVDVWPVEDHADGRRVLSVYPSLDTTIVRFQYAAIRAGRPVTVAVDIDAANLRPGLGLFNLAVATLTIDAPEMVATAGRMPLMDTFAVTRGLEREYLGEIRAQQPFTSAGPRLERDALDALRGGRGRGGHDNAALRAAQLVTDRGRLTPAGALARDLLRKPRTECAAEVRVPGVREPRWFVAHQGRAEAAVLADAPPGSEAAGQSLDVVPAGTVALSLVRWLGVAPAWTFGVGETDDGSITLSAELFEGRMADPGAPPPAGSTPALRRMWRDPWQLARLRSSTAAPVGVLSTAEAGSFSVSPEGDGAAVTITPMPSVELLRVVLLLSGTDTSAAP